MRKHALYMCENKGADQLRGSITADQRLCFLYIDCTIPLTISKFQVSSHLLHLRFVSDLVGNPEDRFSHVGAHF